MESERVLTRHRAAIAAAFLTQGLVLISLTTRLPRFRDRWDLSEVTLSLLLLMMVLLGGVGSVLAEALARRVSSAAMLRVGLGLIAVSVPTMALAPAMGVFAGGLAGYGLALGLVDATTNMQAVALERRYGRPILPSFHGWWTVGGIVGAAITLASGSAPLEVSAALAVVPLVALAAPLLPRGQVQQAVAEVQEQQVPWRPIVLVGVGMLIFYTVDTAASTWGPTYLDVVFATPGSLVALATFPYLVASGAVRLAGDRLVSAYGAVGVLRVGAVVGAIGLAVVVGAPTWPVAVVGFTVLGAGLAVVAPLSFSAAARIAGGEQARVDAVIARLNQFNYGGALLGSVLTGLVGAGSLRFGYVLPLVLVLFLVPLARAFSAPRPSAVGSA